MKSFQLYKPKTNLFPNKFRNRPENGTQAFVTTKINNTNGPTKFRDFGSLINSNTNEKSQHTGNQLSSSNQRAPTKFRSLSELCKQPDKPHTQIYSSDRKTVRTGLKKFRDMPKFDTQGFKPGKKPNKNNNSYLNNFPDCLSKMSNRPESYNDGWDMYSENDKELNCIVGKISYKVTIPDNETKESMVKTIQNINTKLTGFYTNTLDNDVPLIKFYLNSKYCVGDWDNIVNIIESKKYNMGTIKDAILYDDYTPYNCDKQLKAIKKKLKQINTLKKNKCQGDLNKEQKTKLEGEDLLIVKKNTIEYIIKSYQSP